MDFDILPIAIALVIIAMSGAIAYAGDWIAHKVGKKRLSFRGLRPKATAQLGAVALGVGVSLFTMVLITLWSGDVRTWLREGRHAVVARDEALKQLQTTKDDLKTTKDDLTREQSQIKRLDATIRANSTLIGSQKNKMAEEAKALKDLHSQIAEYRAKNESIRAKLSTNARHLREANLRLTKTNKQLASIGRDLAANKLKFKRAAESFNEMVSQNAKLDDDQRKLQAESKVLREEITTIQEDSKKLVAQKNVVQQSLDAAQLSLEETKQEYAKVQADLKSTQARLEEAGYQLNEAGDYLLSELTGRQEPLIYKSGEEVARQPIRGKASARQSETALTTLLREARVSAEGRGARPHTSKYGRYEAAGILGRRVDRDRWVSAEDIQAAIIKQVTGSEGDHVLVAYANMNAFRGEPVPLDVAVLPNPLVFHGREVVAERDIDGRKSYAEILHLITEFLQQDVKANALKAQMIPHANSDESFGTISDDKIVDLMLEVKAANQRVHLQAVAANDTRAADPLRLEFRVQFFK